MQISSLSKQPTRPAWTLQQLVYEHSILLGMVIDAATHLSYTSVLNSYLTFYKLHDFDIDSTPETLSLYITYQSTFINPKSVDSYLSGIVNQMESFFPEVQKNCHSALVSCTLKGTKRQHGVPIHHKNPLSLEDLKVVCHNLKLSSDHDDLLFISQLLIGFHGLLQLSEVCFPDHLALQDFSKISLLSSVQWLLHAFSFWLPSHKSKPTFEGSHIIIQQVRQSPNPHSAFIKYLQSHDQCSTFNPELWLHTNGTVPTWSWFIKCLSQNFPKDIAGQSLCSGSTTNLTISEVALHLIQAAGRWTSEAFQGYICKNPFYYMRFSLVVALHMIILKQFISTTSLLNFFLNKRKPSYHSSFWL